MSEHPVKAIRDRLGCSLQEAKQIYRKEKLTAAIQACRSIDDIKHVLLNIVENDL